MSAEQELATFVDGPYATRELAWGAARDYAALLKRRGLTPRYGVRVFMILGHWQWAVFVVDHDAPPCTSSDQPDTQRD